MQIKKIAIALVLLNFSVQAHSKDKCNVEFSSSQISVLKKSAVYGDLYDMKYTLPAIAWKESSAGKYLVNPADPSFGHFQILIDSAASRENITNIDDKVKLALKIKHSLELGASFAIRELLYWKKVHKGNWDRIWASYNGGFNYKKRMPREYALDIKEKIKYLKKCKIIN